MIDLALSKLAARWRGRWVRRIPGIRLIARLLDGVPDVFISLIMFTLFASVLGALYIWLAPYALHAPEVMGHIAAGWCVERGSCDLTTTVVSMGLGVYLAAVVFLLLSLAITSSAAKTPQSIYFDVVDQLKQAGEAGIRPVQIAKRTGHDLTDVHTILGYLFDDQEVEICSPALGEPVSYRLRPDHE